MADTERLIITERGETVQVIGWAASKIALQTGAFSENTAETGSEPTLLHINNVVLNRQETLTLILKLAKAFGVVVTFEGPKERLEQFENFPPGVRYLGHASKPK